MSEPREASLSAWAARVVAIEGERDEARAERDALRAQLEAATGEVGRLSALLNDGLMRGNRALHAARADVDTLLEAIAVFRRALDDEGGASTDALYKAANEIAAKRGDAS